MDINAAITKANLFQHLVGTLGKGNLLIEAVIPAPVSESLLDTYINDYRDKLIEEEFTTFEELASSYNQHDFNVVILYEGTLHDSYIMRNGDIFWEWHEN